MILGPVFTSELMTLARRRRYYAMRCVYGLFLLFVIWEYNPASREGEGFRGSGEVSIQEAAQIGQWIYGTFAVTQVLALLVLTPALVAGVIADERQRKTLNYLLASRLTSAEIVLGKLAARLLGVGVFLAVGLPVIALLSFVGGIDPNDVLLFFAGCVSTAFFLASVSVAVSVHVRKPREAVSLMYMIELVWLFVPTMVRTLLPFAGGWWLTLYEWIRPVTLWVAVSSPLDVLSRIMLGAVGMAAYEAALWMIGSQVLYGLLFVALAVWRLRPLHRAEGPARGGRLTAAFSQRARRFLPRPPCGDDALLWKERYVARSGPLAKVLMTLAFLGVIGLLVHAAREPVLETVDEIWSQGFFQSVHGQGHIRLNAFLRFTATLAFVCWVIGAASTASGGLSGEREADTWVSLIATPLTPLEIVRAKMFGAFWSTRPVWLLWLASLLVGVVLGALHPLSVLAAAVVAAVNVWVACALGCFLSLRARSSARALTAALAALLFANGGYVLLLLPVGGESTLRFAGVSPFVHGLALMSYDDLLGYSAWPHNPRPGWERLDYLVTGAASVALYGVAALLLTITLIDGFDDAIDRPRTEGGRPPRRRGPSAADPPDPAAEVP